MVSSCSFGSKVFVRSVTGTTVTAYQISIHGQPWWILRGISGRTRWSRGRLICCIDRRFVECFPRCHRCHVQIPARDYQRVRLYAGLGGGRVRVCVGAGVGVGVGVGGREGRERDRKEGACVTPINDSSNLSPVVTGDMCKSRQRLSRSTPRGCTHLLLALII